MADWGELWLNEGFATYFENVGASIARPSYAYAATFYADIDTEALSADALPASTHPLATLTGAFLHPSHILLRSTHAFCRAIAHIVGGTSCISEIC